MSRSGSPQGGGSQAARVDRSAQHRGSDGASDRKELEENSDKLDDATREEVAAAIAGMREALDKDDAPDSLIREKSAALSSASMKIGNAMYESSQAETSDDETPPEDVAPDRSPKANGHDDQVVDAKFEDVDHGGETGRKDV